MRASLILGGFSVLVVLADPSSVLQAQEVIEYQYDALGRISQVTANGGSGGATASSYEYDSAGNRTNVIVSSGGVAICPLETHNAGSSDEFSAYVQVGSSGSSCSENVILSYSVTQISGAGSYTVRGFRDGSNILSAGQEYKLLWIDPSKCTVPDGTTLVLRVNWSSTSGNATFAPISSTVTFYPC